MSASKKKMNKKMPSLAEQLAALSNPTPREYDPEKVEVDAVLGDTGAKLVDVDDSLDFEDLQPTKRGRTLQSDAVMEELSHSYKGTVVSRAQINGDDESIHDELVGEEEEEQEEDEEEDADGEIEEDELESESESDAEEESNDDEAEHQDQTVPMEAISQELEQLHQEEEEEPEVDDTILLRQQKESEQQKSKHVRNQRSLWESMLDTRIRLQHPLTIANRLPHEDTVSEFLYEKPEVKQAYRAAATSARLLLDDLFDLQYHALQQSNVLPKCEQFVPSADLSTVTPSRKRRAAELSRYWGHIETSYNNSISSRNALIDKWNRKTELAFGSQASSKTFKALNQSILTQIENILHDSERLVKRTQLRRTDQRVLGSTNEAKNASITPLLDGRPEIYDEECFDDTDFYQHLLREIIASGLDMNADSADRELMLQARNARKKAKEGVDRRASKGRKVRYTVIPKLVSFAAPIPKVEENAVTDELLTNLFGQVQSS